eukprot:gene17288-23599_t
MAAAAFSIREAVVEDNFFFCANQSDIIMAASDSSRRILMGNWSNHLPTIELYSNVANINGNVLATHMSTNTINCTSFDIYMPSASGVGEYSNYTMPGTIADAYWASNVLSGTSTVSSIHLLSNDEVIRGQRFACISIVSPEDVLVQKETFVLNRFLSDLGKDVDIMLTNITTLGGGGAQQDSIEESVSLIRERYAYLWSDGSMQEELNAYRVSRESILDQEFREATGDVSKTSIRGFKIRGVYGSLDEAKNRAKVISRIDNKFNVYIAEVGCWCPWSPNPDDITDCEYSETQLNTLMKNYYKQQETRNEMYDARKSGLMERI